MLADAAVTRTVSTFNSFRRFNSLCRRAVRRFSWSSCTARVVQLSRRRKTQARLQAWRRTHLLRESSNSLLQRLLVWLGLRHGMGGELPVRAVPSVGQQSAPQSGCREGLRLPRLPKPRQIRQRYTRDYEAFNAAASGQTRGLRKVWAKSKED